MTEIKYTRQTDTYWVNSEFSNKKETNEPLEKRSFKVQLVNQNNFLYSFQTGVPSFLTMMQTACRGYPKYLESKESSWSLLTLGKPFYFNVFKRCSMYEMCNTDDYEV